jgi:hypothetical protein
VRYKSNWHISSNSLDYLQIKTELEKQLLVVELKDKELTMQQREIENLKIQILQLQEINMLFKKNQE